MDDVAALKAAAMMELKRETEFLVIDYQVFAEDGVGLDVIRTRSSHIIALAGQVQAYSIVETLMDED